MRVFVVGASGAIGTRLVPQLIDRGHEVIGTSRSPESAKRVRALGARPVLLDLLDPDAVREAGVRRFVAQSYASARYSRDGAPVKSEDDPLDPAPAPNAREAFAAMRHLDEAVT